MSMPAQDIAREVRERAAALTAEVVDLQYSRDAALHARYGTAGRQRCLEDAGYHLMYLAAAMEATRPALFLDYLGWAKCVLVHRGIPEQDLRNNLECLWEVLRGALPAGSEAVIEPYLLQGMAALPRLPDELPTFLKPSGSSDLRVEYLQLLLDGQRHEASRRIISAVQAGLGIEASYLEVFQPVQYEVGRLWQMNRITVAQEHYCTAATQTIMAQFYPHLFAAPRGGRRAVVATVGGDLHEIGPRMVADLLELNGWDTDYLGANTPAEGIARMIAERGAQVVALSATMTYHLRHVREAIDTIRARPDSREVRILVGGRPFLLEPDLWKDIGADAWARDAREAVASATQLIQGT